MPQMTRLRIGSGGSALSLAFAAGLAAAGGFAATTVPAFAAEGAGVLPSTGSAIFPLLDLTISIINRDYRRSKVLKTVLDTTSYISATPFLSRRIPIFGDFCFRGSFFGPHRTLLGEWRRHPARICSPSLIARKRFQHRGHREHRDKEEKHQSQKLGVPSFLCAPLCSLWCILLHLVADLGRPTR